MNYLMPPWLLASNGIIFRTEDETSAFSEYLSQEVTKRLSLKNKLPDNLSYSIFRDLFDHNSDWKGAFFEILYDLMTEVKENRQFIIGLTHKDSDSLDSIPISQLYLSHACYVKLLARGVYSLGDLIDPNKMKSLGFLHEDIDEIRERGEWLLPILFN